MGWSPSSRSCAKRIAPHSRERVAVQHVSLHRLDAELGLPYGRWERGTRTAITTSSTMSKRVVKHAGASKAEVANRTHNLICILFSARCRTYGVDGSGVPYQLLLIYILPFLLTTDVHCGQTKLFTVWKNLYWFFKILELFHTFKSTKLYLR